MINFGNIRWVLGILVVGFSLWSGGAPAVAASEGATPGPGAQPFATPTATIAAKPLKAPIAPPRRDVPGKRFEFKVTLPRDGAGPTSCTLTCKGYLPEYHSEVSSRAPVPLLTFHCAAWVVEQNLYDSRRDAVSIAATCNAGWNVPFAKKGNGLLYWEAVRAELHKHEIPVDRVDEFSVASFSGGYSAVLGLLGDPGVAPKIRDVLLADSLYAPRVSKSDDRIVTRSLGNVVEFAKRAATPGSGRSFVFTHLYPPEPKYRGNGTSQTAAHVIAQAGLPKQEVSGPEHRGCRGTQYLYRAEKGNARVIGVAGMTTQDHFEHLYGMADLLRMSAIPRCAQAPPDPTPLPPGVSLVPIIPTPAPEAAK